MSNTDRIAETIDQLRRNPSMFLPNEEYSTLVAFISGMLLIGDGDWSGFQSWVSLRCLGPGRSPLAWGAIIAKTVIGDEDANWWDMNDDDSEKASSLLIELLLSYFKCIADE